MNDRHPMIRVDQAGEYGATRIYAGQLAVMGDRAPLSGEIRAMAEQEAGHLASFNALMAKRGVRPTALQPVWAAAGIERAARGEPFPPAVFDPGVKSPDRARDEDRQRGERDPRPLGPGDGRNQRQADRREMRPALPPAHLARIKIEPVLADIRPCEQQRGHAEREPLRQPIGRCEHVQLRRAIELGAVRRSVSSA